MERQLKLLEPNDDREREWRLDEPTKEVGRRGVAQARAMLQQARREAIKGERRHHAA
ncbi:MAG TPA: hypothetical protein VGZ52_13220 [Acidimicrobiales bacterium]|jgi:hypothetical protein|nr:hypothetical protein [Acidimicrobiales bacterium]